MRGGRRNLAVTGSFFLLLSSFLALPRTLSPLPRSHPSLFPQLGLRVGSDVTSAEIPPNSTAQWRAGGRPSPAARRAFQGRAPRPGERGGERAGATRSEAGQGGEAVRPETREPQEEPRERKRVSGTGQGAEPSSRAAGASTPTVAGTIGGEAGMQKRKGICAEPGALINQRWGGVGAGGRPGRPGD